MPSGTTLADREPTAVPAGRFSCTTAELSAREVTPSLMSVMDKTWSNDSPPLFVTRARMLKGPGAASKSKT